MEILHINLAAFASIGLIIYSLKKWAFKGNFFHPGLVYALINAGFFVAFVYGPYIYSIQIPWIYYYSYALITIAFIVGIRLGETQKRRKWVKDIKLTSTQLWVLMLIVLVPLSLSVLESGILFGSFSLEGAAQDNLYRAASGQQNQEEVNIIKYAINQLLLSTSAISTSIFLATFIQKKKYLFGLVWFSLTLLIAIIANSRTVLILNGLILLISFYITKKEQILNRLSVTTLKHKTRKFYKNFRRIVIAIILVLALITVIITNVRTQVRSDTVQGGENLKYEIIEIAYQAKKKQWFLLASQTFPDSVINPLAELSLYAGGTVATGGAVADIVAETGLHTWGLRNFFVVQRVLSQLGLDAGFSDIARENWIKVQNETSKKIPAVRSGWLSDPGNLILDFGYIGAPLASLTTGVLIGWMYSRFYNSGPVIQATATCILTLPMVLTPALHFFSLNISNSINFLFLLCFFMSRSTKKRHQNTYIYLYKEKV